MVEELFVKVKSFRLVHRNEIAGEGVLVSGALQFDRNELGVHHGGELRALYIADQLFQLVAHQTYDQLHDRIQQPWQGFRVISF